MNNQADNIPGIYNYCHRWCERCEFTNRCAVYAEEQEAKKMNPDLADGDTEAVLEYISESMKKTLRLLREEALMHGIDLDGPIEEPEIKKAENPALEQMATETTQSLLKWVEINKERIEQKAKTLSLINSRDVDSLADTLETIYHYAFFVPVKTQRALLPIQFEEPTEMSDKQGSAKAALIGLQHLTDAVQKMHTLFKEEEDSILEFLVGLSKLKKKLEEHFPEAYNFVRPGFDE